MLYVNIEIGLIVFITLVFTFGLILKFKGGTFSQKGNKISRKITELVQLVQETRGFIRQIILYNLNDLFSIQFAKIDKKLRLLQFQNQWNATYPKFIVDSGVMIIIPLIIIIYLFFIDSSFTNEGPVSLTMFVFLLISSQRLIPVANQIYVGIVTVKSTFGVINDFLRLNKNIKIDNSLKNKTPFKFKRIKF